MAVRAIKEKDHHAKIQKMFSISLGRPASDQELIVSLSVLEKLQKKYKENPSLADDYLNVGEFRAPKNVNKTELAALANIGLMILNLDESLTKE